MLKIRLTRIGAKKRPFYRIVAVDERKKRSGAYIDLLGTYNPLTEPKDIKIDQKKLDDWKKKGAVLSNGVLRILNQAPQRPPRKPKRSLRSDDLKEVKEAPVAAPVEQEAAPAEETTPTAEATKTENSENSEEGQQ